MVPVGDLVARITTLFPKVPMVVRSVEAKSPGAALGYLIAIDDVVIAVLPVAHRLPAEVYAVPIELDRVWPGAATAMASHGAHIAVGTVTESHTHGAVLEAAGAMTLVCAALSTLLPVTAAIWTNSETIVNPARLQAAGESVATPKVPLDLWVGLRWLDAPGPVVRQFAVLTSGMEPFIGREIEWMPVPMDPADIAERLLSICGYLIGQGPVMRDGETVGLSAEERIAVRFLPSGQRPGIPVMQLTYSQPASGSAG